MQRMTEKFILLLMVLAALSVTSVISLWGKFIPTDADLADVTVPVATSTTVSTAPLYVFCHSMITVTTPEKRWVVGVHHPDGNQASLEASMRQLSNPEMPPTLTVEEVIQRYEMVTMNCFKSWKDIFDFTDQVSLGGASRKLEDPYHITEHDMRRAVLKLYYKKDWQKAETLFLLQGEH